MTVDVTAANDPPTVADQGFTVAENSANGTVVGKVIATDPDIGDTLSYAITGGDPGGAFAIDAATGDITVADATQLDFESAPVFNLTVTVTDGSALSDTATVTIDLTDLNEAPTAVDAAFTLPESSADGTSVGTVLATDPDVGDTLGFAITAGDPGGVFAIDAVTGEITVADSSQLDFDVTPVYNLTVTVTDGGLLTDTAAVTVTLTRLNTAPVLTPAGPSLGTITEDDTNNAGTVVSSILGASVTDPDSGALEGIAIRGLDSGNGRWEYSTDGGASWSAVGSVSDGNALLLRAGDLIRFVPDGENADAASFSYRAWDQTSGIAGAKVDASVVGGSRAFSVAIDTASITVTALNDAPGLGDADLAAVTADTESPPGETVANLFAGLVSDVDTGSGFAGVAVVGNGADAEGAWEYSTDGGESWFAVGAVGDDATALVLSADTLLRFVPAAGFDGTPSPLEVRGLDDTYAGGFSSTAGGSQSRVCVDTSSNGGTTAISGSTATISTAVTPAEPPDPPIDEIDETVEDPTEDLEEEAVPEEDPPPDEETSEPPVADPTLPDVSAGPGEEIAVPAQESGPGVSFDLSRQASVSHEAQSDALSIARSTMDLWQRVFEYEALIVPGASLNDLLSEQVEFLGELDRLQEEIESFVGLETMVAGSSIAVTMGLSIGYVIWLTRGGLLLASLLSSLPAWRLIDPIAVLAHLGTDDEDDRDEDESLDTIVSRSSRSEWSRPSSPEEQGGGSPASSGEDANQESDPARRGAG
jgi:hypothetical protein